MSKLKKAFDKKWIRTLSNKYVLISVIFLAWMLFLDSNNYFIHKELNDEIEELEKNKKYRQEQINSDLEFIEKMKDTTELEKYARETYYLKKEDEDIFIITETDSTQVDNEQ